MYVGPRIFGRPPLPLSIFAVAPQNKRQDGAGGTALYGSGQEQFDNNAHHQMLHHRSLRRDRALPIGIAVLEPQHSIRIRDGHDDDRTTTTTGFPTMVADAALVSLLHGLAWTKLDARIPARCGAPW